MQVTFNKDRDGVKSIYVIQIFQWIQHFVNTGSNLILSSKDI